MLYDAPELMNASEVLTAIGLAGIFVYFMVPSVIIVLSIYGIHRHRKNAKLRKKMQQEHLENLKKMKVETEKQFKSQQASTVLNDIEAEPNDKTKFSSLTLEFDETGRVKE